MIGPWTQRTTQSDTDGPRIIGFFGLTALLVVVVRLFMLDVVYIDGRSMAPTLQEGSVVFVNKLAYGIRRPFRYGYLLRWAAPRRGDIISLRDPRTGDRLVKRAFALAGDLVATNGSTVSLGEPAADMPVFGAARRYFGTIARIPEDTIVVLGDNPTYSIDSRHFGPVSVRLISGRVTRKVREY